MVQQVKNLLFYLNYTTSQLLHKANLLFIFRVFLRWFLASFYLCSWAYRPCFWY